MNEAGPGEWENDMSLELEMMLTSFKRALEDVGNFSLGLLLIEKEETDTPKPPMGKGTCNATSKFSVELEHPSGAAHLSDKRGKKSHTFFCTAGCMETFCNKIASATAACEQQAQHLDYLLRREHCSRRSWNGLLQRRGEGKKTRHASFARCAVVCCEMKSVRRACRHAPSASRPTRRVKPRFQRPKLLPQATR